jgi:alpha-1,2-glucosyltransferase
MRICITERRVHISIAWLLIAAGLIISYILMRQSGPICDESWHIWQIEKFFGKDFSKIDGLTIFPAYHFIIYVLLSFRSAANVQDIRFVSYIISILCAPVFFFITKQVWNDKIALFRTIQFTFLPIVFFMFPLIYTDLWALLFVLLMLLAVLKGRIHIAALCGAIAVAIRQPSVIWVAFVWLLLLQREQRFRDYTFTHIIDWLRKTWSFAVLFIIFCVFVIINRGVAVGDKDSHEVGIYFGNIWFFFAVFFIFSLPYCWKWVKEAYIMALKNPITSVVVILGTFAVIIGTYSAKHPYNQADYLFYLRNRLLYWTTLSYFHKMLASIPIAIGLFGFLKTRFVQARFSLLLPVTIASLMVLPLVEQRYYIIPFVFYIAFRNQEDEKSEKVQTCLFVVVSLTIMIGVSRYYFFL